MWAKSVSIWGAFVDHPRRVGEVLSISFSRSWCACFDFKLTKNSCVLGIIMESIFSGLVLFFYVCECLIVSTVFYFAFKVMINGCI